MPHLAIIFWWWDKQGAKKQVSFRVLTKIKYLAVTYYLRVDWVSKIDLSNNREDEIRQCFSYTKVEFHYRNDVEDLNLIIETFQKKTCNKDKKTNDNCNIFGENKKFFKLIVMDDVSDLADKLNDFANFLTVSRKFRYICLYIFHVIYPIKSIW